MARQAAERFLDKVNEDNQIREDFARIQREAGDNWVTKAIAYASEHGYDFTEEEFLAVMDERFSGDLTDEQLDQIAGAGGPRLYNEVNSEHDQDSF